MLHNYLVYPEMSVGHCAPEFQEKLILVLLFSQKLFADPLQRIAKRYFTYIFCKLEKYRKDVSMMVFILPGRCWYLHFHFRGRWKMKIIIGVTRQPEKIKVCFQQYLGQHGSLT